MTFRLPAPASLLLLLLLLLLSTSTADENSLLLTGEVLGTDSELSNSAATFVIQGDCNLVLYNNANGFQSNTHAEGTNCTLTLSDHGQLIIHSSDQSTVWLSAASSTRGRYAAVLRLDGQLAVYGPTVWSIPVPQSTAPAPAPAPATAPDTVPAPATATAPDTATALATALFEAELAALPTVNNMLFSGQVLYDGAELTTRDYAFVMKTDCGLALVKGSEGDRWSSGTEGKGKHCFARLDHRGVLTVNDDGYKKMWGSKSVGLKDGEYVLVLQINGEAVIYGPMVWSTLSG